MTARRSQVPAVHSAYPPGRQSKVTTLERSAIQVAYLLHGLTQRAVAEQFGRSGTVVQKILASPDTQRLRDELLTTTTDQARLRLQHAVPEAVTRWIEALAIASRRGDHRPAKELLMHMNVIAPIRDDARGDTRVFVNVGMPGRPAMKAPTLAELTGIVEVDPEPKG